MPDSLEELAAKQKAAQEAEQFFEDLNAEHPNYEKWSPIWSVFRDVVGDDEPDKRDYLHKNTLEPDKQYEFRLLISELISESPRSISRLTGALFREKPKRDLKDAALTKFNEDVDLEGQNMNSFMEKVVSSLLAYGTTRLLINMKRSPGIGSDLTRADEIKLGIRPYIIPYNPLSVIDWDHDEYGQLTMVRIRETRIGKIDPSDATSSHVMITKFIHYDRMKSQWWEFAEDQGKHMVIGAGSSAHELGFVPMIVAYWPKRVKHMIGASYIRSMAKADVQKFRVESDQDYDAYLHAHPTLKVWTEDEMDKIGVGSNSYLKLKPATQGQEKEDALYVEAPTSAFDALEQIRKGKLETIDRHSNTDPLGVMDSGSKIFQASGVARAWSFGMSEARILSDVADTAAQIERQIYEMVLRFQDRTKRVTLDEKAFKGWVTYPEEFDLATTDQLIQQTEKISQMVNSPKFLRLLHKRIATSKAGDIKPAELEAIHKEIEKNPLVNTPVGKQLDAMGFPKMPTPPAANQQAGKAPKAPNVSGASKQGQRSGSFQKPTEAAKAK